MELILIEPGSLEWNFIWTWLEAHPINKGIENPSIALNKGESWQYMGSYMQDDRVLHSFRHRHHPTIDTVSTVSVGASPNFTQEQITKRFRL